MWWPDGVMAGHVMAATCRGCPRHGAPVAASTSWRSIARGGEEVGRGHGEQGEQEGAGKKLGNPEVPELGDEDLARGEGAGQYGHLDGDRHETDEYREQ